MQDNFREASLEHPDLVLTGQLDAAVVHKSSSIPLACIDALEGDRCRRPALFGSAFKPESGAKPTAGLRYTGAVVPIPCTVLIVLWRMLDCLPVMVKYGRRSYQIQGLPIHHMCACDGLDQWYV